MNGEQDVNEESLAFSKRGSVTRSPTNLVTPVTKVKTATVVSSTPVLPMKGPTFKGPTKGIDKDRVRTESMSSTGSKKELGTTLQMKMMRAKGRKTFQIQCTT